jgi:hypothetical protein
MKSETEKSEINTKVAELMMETCVHIFESFDTFRQNFTTQVRDFIE